MTTHTETSPAAVRRAMFNQGAPMSAGLIHEQIHQGSHALWPPVSQTQATLDAMQRAGQVQRVGCQRWGFAYWLRPLEGFERPVTP